MILDAVTRHIDSFPQTKIDYASLVNSDSLDETGLTSGQDVLGSRDGTFKFIHCGLFFFFRKRFRNNFS